MPAPSGTDFLDKARSISASVMFAAGVAAIAGSVLEWVRITRCPPRIPPSEIGRCAPYTGLDVWDGWVVLAGGVIVLGCATLLVLQARSLWARIGFFVSMVVGAVAVAAYRGIGDFASAVSQRSGIIGEHEPALGITLVAAAGFTGIVASVAGIAATPRSAS